MKLNKLNFFMSLMMVLCALSASAYDFMVDGIAYNINGNEATVTYTDNSNNYSNNYSGVSGELVVPETVTYNSETYTITSIGTHALSYCKNIASITLPNSITTIAQNAFYHCTGLTSVTIGNSINEIGYDAFNGCNSLTMVNISDLAAWCIIKFTGFSSNPLFYAHRLFLNGEEVNNLVLPESVTSIGESAFLNCTDIESVTIPNSVTAIGKNAFQGCIGLTNLAIPNSVTSIEMAAFRYCSGLKSVTIPNSVTYIGSAVFHDCTGLTSVEIPNSLTYISSSLFNGCSSLTSVTIPNSVTSIGSQAFSGCSSLANITIPNSVTSISEQAFQYCTALTSVTIPNSVSSIEWNTFLGCSGLISVKIPNSVTIIDQGAFYNCCSLTNVTIPNSVTSIGNWAFKGCTNLTSISIPNSVTTIGDEAFRGCSELTNISIGNSVRTIGHLAFLLCTKLQRVQFNAVNCTSLLSETFPGTVTLSNLHFGDSVQYIPLNLPKFSMPDKILVLPNSVKSIDVGALNGTCNAIVLGENIENIVEGTFPDGISVAYVSSTTPLPCSSGAFANPQTLYVPQGCKGKYLMSDGWGEFASIIEGNYTPVTNLTLYLDSASMHKSEILQLNASLLPEDHSGITLEWWSSNSSVATVSSTGLITAVAGGESDIWCCIDNQSAVCHITVIEDHIDTCIQLNYPELLLDWDNIVDLTATIYPENVDQSVTWTIPENDNLYARVVGNKLRVMAKRSGSVTVTATSVADPSVSADCVITIQIPDVNGDTSLNIADVTALIDYLLGGNPESINIGDADVNRDGNINIADVTTLIDKLLSGN